MFLTCKEIFHRNSVAVFMYRCINFPSGFYKEIYIRIGIYLCINLLKDGRIDSSCIQDMLFPFFKIEDIRIGTSLSKNLFNDGRDGISGILGIPNMAERVFPVLRKYITLAPISLYALKKSRGGDVTRRPTARTGSDVTECSETSPDGF